MKYKNINTAITAFKKKNKSPDYNDWFAFFQKLEPYLYEEYVDELKKIIPSDGYSALMRWLDIFKNPSKMEKISKAKMDEENETDLIGLATGDDDEAFYVGMLRKASSQLNNSGTSPQEVARLTANINIFRKELREIRSRKPKAGSVLDKVLLAASKKPKTPVIPAKSKGKTRTKPSQKVSARSKKR